MDPAASNLSVYLGFDSREAVTFEVAEYSILKHASRALSIFPLRRDKLEVRGLLTRPLEWQDGRFFDPISQAPASTEFAVSRFLAPVLHQSGWAVFMDSDMVFVEDIHRIFRELDPRFAVQCVQHLHQPSEKEKMDGQVQTAYPRKNWSSFFAFNADHPANDRLTLEMVNGLPGRELHAFCWLEDDEIGPLEPGWNWLVNAQPRPELLYNAHFTLGGPWFPEWSPQPHDDLWSGYHEEMLKARGLPTRHADSVRG